MMKLRNHFPGLLSLNSIVVLLCLGTFSLIRGKHPWTSQSHGLQAQFANLRNVFFFHFMLKKLLKSPSYGQRSPSYWT